MTVAVVPFHWDTFFQYIWPPDAFKNPLIVNGLWLTIIMAVVAQIIGILLGLLAAFGQMSRFGLVRSAVGVYIIYFRGTPLLVQLSLIYFGLASLGLYNFPDIHLLSWTIPGAVQAGIVGLGLNEGAYMAEIIRAGIGSIEVGQMEAAKALGMPFGMAMRMVILPQAARVIIPPLGNEFNNMLKSTTLVVNIGAVELFNAFEQVNAVLFQPFELFLAVSVYYLILTIIWGFVQSWLERRLGDRKGVDRPPGSIRRLLGGSGLAAAR